ncbi:MAG TPA: DUF3048 domain-containing protein [Acidimicrobiales bacterium]|nr:DUF3048 domain-containing protein [Acidimicrobiales bacterium]
MANPSSHARPSGLRRLRSNLARSWRRAGAKGRIAVSLGVVLVLALVTTGVTLLATSSSRKAAGGTTTTGSSTTTSTRPKVVLNSKICPLTGTPAPKGRVPRRPALGVKIGNDPSSRPQTGLPDADIVYEEMAEGGITRYLAIFQCHAPPVIGPVRSVRWDDWHILQSYGHPMLAFSGGIQPWDDEVASLPWLFDASGSEGPTVSAYYRTTNRVPPWNYYTSGAGLWALDSNHTPPPQQFSYSKQPPAGAKPAVGITIEYFASGSTVQWRWSASAHAWMRSVGGEPDVDVSGSQLQATNVIVETVATEPGPYNESGPDSPDVESITEGSGKAWVLTDGKAEVGTWNCPAYGDLTQYRFDNGQTMTLQPGNTWVELVPNENYPVSLQR